MINFGVGVFTHWGGQQLHLSEQAIVPTGMSMVLSNGLITPIYVGWIRPLGR